MLPALTFAIRPLVHSVGRICFAAIAAEQRRFLGCLSNHDGALAVLDLSPSNSGMCFWCAAKIDAPSG
jgi:hypothetical protein